MSIGAPSWQGGEVPTRARDGSEVTRFIAPPISADAPPARGLALRHRDPYAALVGHLDRAVVARVDVADHAHAGVVGEHPLDLLRGQVGAVGDA